MKVHLGILILIILILSSCVNRAPSSDDFEYPELKQAFLESILLSGWSGKDIYVYEEFSNKECCELINIVYQSFNEDINYELNDSIVNLLENREDRNISKRLIDEPGVDIQLIKDTTNYHNYIVFSYLWGLSEAAAVAWTERLIATNKFNVER